MKDQNFVPKINCLEREHSSVLCSISSLGSPGQTWKEESVLKKTRETSEPEICHPSLNYSFLYCNSVAEVASSEQFNS